AHEDLMKKERTRVMCMNHIRNALGYPLSEAMFQQAGWSSEGIDVSHDSKVAMAFALSKWEGGRGRLWARPDPAVLYRFRVDRPRWGFDDLRSYNYYSCPSFVPTREICRLFRTGSDNDFRASLFEYQRAIIWDAVEFELELLQGARPFEVLRLP